MVNCVYIHIPFCEKKCNYCAFCSYSSLSYIDEYITALIKEIKFHYKKEQCSTIYFGGGTPSILNEKQICKILSCFNYDKSTEITLEANPCSLSYEKLKGYKNLGINRISIGVQNFNDNILNMLGRNHTRKDIYNALEYVNRAGIGNMSIDLMYGLPNQNLKQWEETLNKAIKISPKHISLYGLKIEKGTKFYKLYGNNEDKTNNIQADMYKLAHEKLKDYIHYEFSNFAKGEEYISKHNSAYWERRYYYGFGLSASGFIENKRYTNTINIKEYMKNPPARNYTELSQQEEIEEEIFLGLRLAKGIDFKKINKKYNIDIYSKYKKIFDKFLNDGYMLKTDKGIKLSLNGVLVSNEILCEFIDI